ncbi:MAG TPA: type II toxin-antitoxin system VapC family toxin [Candidatus Latescibacteria bacterium]|nr:VapC toxin family PIN domain ribonuclease [Gemmatimonadaceae bacterium]MDP6016586.1 type II toxin-antitoxin system VapC family toxin [Candidatus Latescibacterota bacterium]HJP34078.1 type II toxin-antitoxin system VapC family toxin [Candidatus Latescibacterota bacterium]
MIVADTNLIAYLLIQGEHTELARRALRKDAAWAAPLLWRSEFNSVLSLYMRQGELELAGAVALVGEALRLLGGREFRVPCENVLELVSRSSRSAYDCEFAALAHDLSATLVSSDARLVAAFPELAVSLADFVADTPSRE